jgi:DNA polymerase I-like protein with 3'-5' exonuclease and polymerase domains
MTHSSPNTANIPKAHEKVPYGKEMRSLWTVGDPETRRLVGYDAAGLEMRMFAHYLGIPEVAELYINGDPHQVNADLLGIDRSTVKNVFYAFLYGAANEKLGTTGGHNSRWGKNARGLLINKTPGLKELVALVQHEQASGLLETIDGGKIRCPSPHAALNYKLQSAGGIVMKQASILLDGRVIEKGLDALKVGDIHDEGQGDVAINDADEYGKMAVQCIRDAGEELGFSVPLDGDYKVGLSWAETH